MPATPGGRKAPGAARARGTGGTGSWSGVRLEAARTDIEAGDDTLDVVAERCGLGNAESLRRVFHRHLGVSPGACWRRFRTTTPHQGALA
jgi:transcriptional regulator GlxA family with amidase domain